MYIYIFLHCVFTSMPLRSPLGRPRIMLYQFVTLLQALQGLKKQYVFYIAPLAVNMLLK
jgi:hypothetical protein